MSVAEYVAATFNFRGAAERKLQLVQGAELISGAEKTLKETGKAAGV